MLTFLLYRTLNNFYRDSISFRNLFNSFWAYSAIFINLSLCNFIFCKISAWVCIISFCFCIIHLSLVHVFLLLVFVICLKILLPISLKFVWNGKVVIFINLLHRGKHNERPFICIELRLVALGKEIVRFNKALEHTKP